MEIGDGAQGSAAAAAAGGPAGSGPDDAGSGRAGDPCPGDGGAPDEPDAGSSAGAVSGEGGGGGGAPAAYPTGDDAGDADASGGGDDGGAAADLRPRLLAAEGRAGELEAQLRRALADYRNLERRARDGVDAAVRDRVARFAADMVSVRDDFERAARVAAPGGASAGAGAVSSGLRAVLQGMDSALSKHGVTPIEAIGEIFDPRRHEAVASAVDAALDEGTITSEVERGYSLDERIIRPSRVVISKKPATEEVGA